jgi:hypothetical protein
VVDPQDLDPICGVGDVVQDPVRASTGAAGAFEFSLERLADLSGCPREVAENELDNRRNDSWRDVGPVPARGPAVPQATTAGQRPSATTKHFTTPLAARHRGQPDQESASRD